MDIKKTIPTGIKDYYGKELYIRCDLEKKLLSLYDFYNYNEIETPTFEYLKVFAKTFDEALNLYVLDNKEGELLALKSDETKAIARVVKQMNPFLGSLKLCYSTKKYLSLSKLNGDFHELNQCGVEYIGNSNPKVDAEVIRLAILSLMELGCEDFSLHICSTAFLNALFKDLKLDDVVVGEITEYITKKDLISIEELLKTCNVLEDVREKLQQFLVAIGDIELLKKLQKELNGTNCKKELDYLEQIYNELGELNKYVSFDFSISTLENYYTGIYFLGYVKGNAKELLSGGRYNNFITNVNYSSPLPAIGFGLNLDDAVKLLMDKYPLYDKKTIYLYFDEYNNQVNEYISSIDKTNYKLMIVNEDSYEKALDYYKNNKGFKFVYINSLGGMKEC